MSIESDINRANLLKKYLEPFYFEASGAATAEQYLCETFVGKEYFVFFITGPAEALIGKNRYDMYDYVEEDLTYREIIKHVAKKLWDEGSRVNKSKFCFVNPSEGYHYGTLCFLSDLMQYMHQQYQLQFPNDMALLCGAATHPINISYLKKHKTQFNFSNFKVVCCNSLEVTHASHIIFKTNGWDTKTTTIEMMESDTALSERIIALNTKPKPKPYKFLMYNNMPKLNRTYLVGHLIKRNLHPYGLISLNNINEANWYDAMHHFNDELGAQIFPRETKDILQVLENNKNLILNLHLDYEDGDSLKKDALVDYAKFQPTNIDHMEKAYFGLCTETKFMQDLIRHEDNKVYVDTPDSNFIDCITFTEKTWKFVIGKMPFILAGMPGALKVLRDMGYKTFHPYINETYDSIIDDEMRSIAIAEEVERLCHLSDDAWIEMLYNMQDIIDHNFNKFFNESGQCSMIITLDHPRPKLFEDMQNHIDSLKIQSLDN